MIIIYKPLLTTMIPPFSVTLILLDFSMVHRANLLSKSGKAARRHCPWDPFESLGTRGGPRCKKRYREYMGILHKEKIHTYIYISNYMYHICI